MVGIEHEPHLMISVCWRILLVERQTARDQRDDGRMFALANQHVFRSEVILSSGDVAAKRYTRS